ncbi:exoribonuclease family protein [Paraphoma chrysanthemicola]|uniref:Ribosomal RNA-processing protein 43 n=1 Tax=Paraphoma chrysanthemicola TaxID=798071 RepID=A0A8K0RCL5_9PLEO|nr:exoribonuclease family protein [Paraphoma chrysanthemicola]
MATAPPEQQQQQPPSLTFPRPIFAAVSPHPFLQAHLSANKKVAIRANGRTEHMFRKPGINTGSLTHANGSAVVRLGNTSVVCGVRAEVLREEDVPGTNEFHVPTSLDTPTEEADGEDEDDSEEIDTLRLVVPNVELSTGSTPSHIPGNAPSSTQQSLITRLRSLILSTRLLRASDLRILYKPSLNALDADADDEAQIVVKAYWVLYVDIFFISIDGSAFDAAWMSLLAALRDTKLPRAWWDEEFEGILCSDAPEEAKRLRLRGFPVAATFAVLEGGNEIGAEGEDEKGEWILSDPDAFEESVCRESVTVVVDGEWEKGGKGAMVRRIEKSGGGVVGREGEEGMRTVIRRAAGRWRDVKSVMEGE